MENDSEDGKSAEPTIPTEQTSTPDTPEPTPTQGTFKRGVFLARAKGQSFEQFEDACVAAFRKAGLIKD